MVNRCCSLDFLFFYLWGVVVQWKKYVQCGNDTFYGTYANNVKGIDTSTHSHIVDCSEFICMQIQILMH